MSDWLTMLMTRQFAVSVVMLELNLVELGITNMAAQASQLCIVPAGDPSQSPPVPPFLDMIKTVGGEINAEDLQQDDAIPRFWDSIVRFFDNRVATTESHLRDVLALMSVSKSLSGTGSSTSANGNDPTQGQTGVEQDAGMFFLIAQSGTSGNTHDHATGSNLATLVTQYNMDEPS